MTAAELAAALRERFCQLRVTDYPGLAAQMAKLSDATVLMAHFRCGACKRYHTPLAVFINAAARHETLESFLDEQQSYVKGHWPPACLRRLDAMEADLQASRPS